MSQTSTVQVQNVSERSGQSGERQWTKWALQDMDGNWYGTFERGVVLANMKGQTVEIEWEQSGNFRNLLRAVAADGSVPSQGTFQAPASVGVDWDKVGLQKTRCALWAAYLTEALPQAFGYWVSVQTDPPGTLDITNFITRVGKSLILSAETDIFMREPVVEDTDDVPF